MLLSMSYKNIRICVSKRISQSFSHVDGPVPSSCASCGYRHIDSILSLEFGKPFVQESNDVIVHSIDDFLPSEELLHRFIQSR